MWKQMLIIPNQCITDGSNKYVYVLLTVFQESTFNRLKQTSTKPTTMSGDIETAGAVLSELGNKNDDNVNEEEQNSIPNATATAPSQGDKTAAASKSETKNIADSVENDENGNEEEVAPTSTEDKDGEDNNNNESVKRDVVESLRIHLGDDPNASGMSRFYTKLRSQPEYLVLGFSIFVLLMVIIVLPSVNGTLNTKMDEHQQAFKRLMLWMRHKQYMLVIIMDGAMHGIGMLHSGKMPLTLKVCILIVSVCFCMFSLVLFCW